MESEQVDADPQQDLPPEKIKRPFNKRLWLLVGLSVLIVGGVAAWWLRRDKHVNDTSANTETEQSTELGDYEADITGKLELKQIKLTGTGTQGIDIDTETGLVYAGAYSGINNKCMAGNTNAGQSFLNVVDPEKREEIAAVETDQAPIWPAVDPEREVVYVAASSGTVAVHKKGTGQRTSSIRVGGLPHMPALLDKIMVVSNTFDQSQTYYTAVDLDTQQVVANHKGPRLPHPIAVDNEAGIAYMMGVEAAEVVIIDMKTGSPLGTFNLAGGGGQMVFAKKQGRFITDSSQPGSSVAIFDGESKELLSKIGFQGADTPGSGLAIDEESGLLFVVLSEQNAVGVASLDTLKPLGFFKTGACPYAVKIDSMRGRGYVSNTADGTLTVFDLKQLKTALSK